MSSVATRACSCPCTRSPQQGTVVRPISVRVPSQRSSHQTLRVLRLGLLSRHHAGLAAPKSGLSSRVRGRRTTEKHRCCGSLSPHRADVNRLTAARFQESSLAVSDLSCRRKENGGWEMLFGNRMNPLATFAPNPRSLVCPKTLLDCLDSLMCHQNCREHASRHFTMCTDEKIKHTQHH